MVLYTSGELKQTKNNRIMNKNYTQHGYSHYREISGHTSFQRSKMRKNIKKQQAARVGYFIIFLAIFGIIMPKIFFDNLNTLFIRRLENQNIQIPSDISYMNQAESLIVDNGDFLDTKILNEPDIKDPLMKAPVLKGKMYSLTNNLKFLAAQYPRIQAGVFVWDYDTGKYVDINGDKVFPTASIIKLPVMFQVFRRYEKGLINLSDKIKLTDYYVSGGSGTLQYSPLGTALSYMHLAKIMIRESDNTATNMLLSSVGGMNELNSEIKRWGLKETSLSNWLPDLTGTNVSTPKEMGTILYNIGNTNLLSIRTRAEIINIMSHVRNNHLIQAGLPPNARFVHKTGDIGHMLGDAGIVALPDGRKYIIVVMVKRPWNYYPAKQFIIDASKTVYNSYMSGNL